MTILSETALTLEVIGESVAGAMAAIREDVKHGVAGNIEPDAVLLNVAYKVAELAGLDNAEREEFLAKCDLVDLIPEETFRDQRGGW